MPGSSLDIHKHIKFLIIVVSVLLVVTGGYLANSMGLVSLGKTRTITVKGTASSKIDNQVATFNVGVNVTKAVKTTAVKEMNDRMDNIISSVKNFGILEEDIKTTYISVYQQSNWDPTSQKSTLGDWIASSNIDIKLRDTSKADELSALLSSLETDNVYGPNFAVEDENVNDAEILAKAVANATEKAMVIAKANGKNLGSILSITEGYNAYDSNMYYSEGLGGGGAESMVPGTTDISKTVTVTFSLR
ncbi:MAG: hypothetical protein ACD_22C00132G0002 [uncultured bacterium]|nr:MAG: hypothetical protein ACD_22C00132G0002 [uncultured bacterium]